MITTTVSKIILSDKESSVLLLGLGTIESIFDALREVGTDATLSTSDGVDISTEDFYKYLSFLWDLKNSSPNSFIINEETKEV